MDSELIQHLEQAESSYQAARNAFSNPTIMAPFEFIDNRMTEIEIARDKIAAIVGDVLEATDMVIRWLAQIESHG